VRWPTRIAQQVAYLTRSVESSDFAPTSQHQAVHAELHGEVLAVQEEYEGLIRNELATFNAMLASRGLQGVVPRN